MKIKVEKKRYKLFARKQITILIVSDNGRNIFSSTESYNNLGDALSSLYNNMISPQRVTLHLPDGRVIDNIDEIEKLLLDYVPSHLKNKG